MSSVAAELFYANGRTDSLTKIIVALHNFYKFFTYFRTRLAFCPIQHKVTCYKSSRWRIVTVRCDTGL